MALSEFTKKQVQVKIGSFCESIIPNYLKTEIRSTYYIRGNNVTIFEERPAISAPDEWIKIKVAQLRFDSEKKEWSLYWCDHKERWYRYEDTDSTPDLDSLLEVLDEDGIGVFWG